MLNSSNMRIVATTTPSSERVWNQQYLSLDTKFRIYSIYVLPGLLYGSESCYSLDGKRWNHSIYAANGVSSTSDGKISCLLERSELLLLLVGTDWSIRTRRQAVRFHTHRSDTWELGPCESAVRVRIEYESNSALRFEFESNLKSAVYTA